MAKGTQVLHLAFLSTDVVVLYVFSLMHTQICCEAMFELLLAFASVLERSEGDYKLCNSALY